MSPAERKEKTRRYHFDGFTLDVELHALFHGEERVHLTSKPLETLIHLVEHRGRTVGKQALLDAVWKEASGTEDTLVHAVREIRRVLEDDKDNPRFVQTVPREGYRFVGPVLFDEPDQAGAGSPPTPAGAGEEQTPPALETQRLSFLPLLKKAAVMLIALSSIWGIWHFRRSRTTTTVEVKPDTIRQLTSGKFKSGKAAFSPDGKFFVCVSSEESPKGVSNLYLYPIAGGNRQRITDDANPSGDLPVFTADGNHVVFSRARKGEDGNRIFDLWIAPAFGGASRLFIPEASGAGFSPDGKWVAYTKHLSSSRKPLRRSLVNNLAEHLEISEQGFMPRWSPDGKWIAWTTSNPNGGDGDLWLASADSPVQRRQLTRESLYMYGLNWAADSRTLIFAAMRGSASMQLWKTSIDGGEITSLLTGVGHYLGPGASPDGKDLIFYHAMDSKNLMAASVVSGSEPEPVTHGQFHGRPRLSPSGTRVASLMRQPDVKEHLYVTGLQTKKQTPLSEQTASHQCWLDDDTLAYLSSVPSESSTDVVVIDLAKLRSFLLTRFAGRAESLAVDSYRKRVAVVLRPADGKQRIVLRDLSGDENEDQVLAEGAEYEYLRWRPDGTLSWSGPRVGSQSNGIWVFEQNQPRQLVKDGYGPVWNADGSVVYYARTGEQAGLWRAEAHGQWQPKFVRPWKGQVDFDLAGGRLVFTVEDDYYHVYSTSLTP